MGGKFVQTSGEIDSRLPCVIMLLILVHDYDVHTTGIKILLQIARRVGLVPSFMLMV
jgi:hypothetical protein